MPFLESPAYALERDLISLTNRMTAIGFPFDRDKGIQLHAQLQQAVADTAAQLQTAFPPQLIETPFVPKRDNKTKGYVAGVVFMKRKWEPFNPNSGPQIAERLQERYAWEPKVFTETGQPSVTSKVLRTLAYPEAALLCDHSLAIKRIGMLENYLEATEYDGRLHTDYLTNATITGRASHSPNIAQVCRVKKGPDGAVLRGAAGAWGFEMRDAFRGTEDLPIVIGSDISGLEAVCMAHHLFPFDGGEYAERVLGGDIHTHTQELTGLETRGQAKTLNYAMIYGCGNLKAGTIALPDEEDEDLVRAIGHDLREAVIEGITGFKDLLDSLNDGTLEMEGLDGRRLVARKEYSKLNTMLQSDGAILCKRWLLLIDAALQARGLQPGTDYEFLGWIHDELVSAARTREIAEIIAQTCKEQAVKAGEYYHLKCPLAADAHIGVTWADVH